MGWSDWQDGYDLEALVFPDAHFYNQVAGDLPGVGSPRAEIEAAVAAIEGGSGRWIDFSEYPGFLIQLLYDIHGHATGSVLMEYEAVNLRPSVNETQLPLVGFFENEPPGGFPSDMDPIPPDLLDARCPGFGYIQFETASQTFTEWVDWTSPPPWLMYTGSFGAGTIFTPPAATPFAILVTDPLTSTTPPPDELNCLDESPQYLGPHILPSDLDPTPVVTFDMNAIATGPDAPYSPSSQQTDIQNIDLPMSSMTRKDLALVALPRYFIDEPLPFSAGDFSSPDGMEFAGLLSAYAGSHAALMFSSYAPPAKFTTPRWRYWRGHWRTVGGHFATAGGAAKRILTPGQGWLDVLDGPA